MSLKAKLEAVIYAAEEPVTLAQLAVIFADEVLPATEPEAVQLPLNGHVPEQAAQPVDAQDGEAQPEAQPEAQVEAQPEPQSEAPPETAAAASAVPAESPAPEDPAPENDESAGKKLARQRDRSVRLELQKILDELLAEYAASDRGMEIREIAGGYRMATKPEYHDAVRGFVKSLKPPMKLSLQALETLAVIAYKQPVTAPEVSEIRGVDSGGVLGSLISRKLIATAGRKPVIGRPILYKTTKEFLLRFGLKDVNDLPSMEEFEKMAGELAESEAEIEAPALAEEGSPEASAGSSPAEPSTDASAEASAATVEATPETAGVSPADAAEAAPEVIAESIETATETPEPVAEFAEATTEPAESEDHTATEPPPTHES
jgi:segregation and condensation protein B